MNCPKCDELVGSEDRFCGNCGADLSDSTPQVTSTQTNERLWIGCIILVIMVIVLIQLGSNDSWENLDAYDDSLLDNDSLGDLGSDDSWDDFGADNYSEPDPFSDDYSSNKTSLKTLNKLNASKVKSTQSKARLTVSTRPEGARVKILNIKPKYRDGIELKPGSYHIDVTLNGYQRYLKWIKLNSKDVVHSVVLNKNVQVMSLVPSGIQNRLSQSTVKPREELYQTAFLYADIICVDLLDAMVKSGMLDRPVGISINYSKRGFASKKSALSALDRWWGHQDFKNAVMDEIQGTECEIRLPRMFKDFELNKLLSGPFVDFIIYKP